MRRNRKKGKSKPVPSRDSDSGSGDNNTTAAVDPKPAAASRAAIRAAARNAALEEDEKQRELQMRFYASSETTVAGTYDRAGFADSAGSPVLCQFDRPCALCVVVQTTNEQRTCWDSNISVPELNRRRQASGSGGGGSGGGSEHRFIIVADTYNHRVRMVRAQTGAVSTRSGGVTIDSKTGKTITDTLLPSAVCVLPDADEPTVLVSCGNTIRGVKLGTGEVYVLAGKSEVKGWLDGPRLSSNWNSPSGIVATDRRAYVADRGNHMIRCIDFATGVVSSVLGNGRPGTCASVHVKNNTASSHQSNHAMVSPLLQAQIEAPVGLAFDPTSPIRNRPPNSTLFITSERYVSRLDLPGDGTEVMESVINPSSHKHLFPDELWRIIAAYLASDGRFTLLPLRSRTKYEYYQRELPEARDWSGIAVLPSGLILATCINSAESPGLYVFDRNPTNPFSFILPKWIEFSTDGLNCMTGLAIDTDERVVYVSDYWRHCVVRAAIPDHVWEPPTQLACKQANVIDGEPY